ncbi:MAG: GNAT family N-acetyltransferase [Rhodobacteraceae bacterium]|nr:GNAT family N-acetyltransferase [Paracoccaceae bacterium]
MRSVIETGRLILRPWRAADIGAFAAMNADAEVMAHFPKRLTRADSAAMMARVQDHFGRHGFGFGAVERKADRVVLGMAGLAAATFEAPVTPCVEVGWRLARAHWGMGYATEAARGWLAHGFDALALREIVAFVVPANLRSQAVMTRLGMRRDPGRDFEHPALPEGHVLRPHWLYAVAGAARTEPPP